MNFFPSDLYRFIYRNYDLLPTERIARFLVCKKSDVKALAQDLALPPLPLPPFERALPAIIRRNWHLVPREDVARLVGLSREEFNKILLEMDYLDVKLGGQPPVKPIRWKAPSARERSRARRLGGKMSPYLENSSQWEAPFAFVPELSKAPEGFRKAKRSATQKLWDPCIFYSYIGTYGDVLLTGEDCYPDGILARLAERGVNGVWVPTQLRDLAPSKAFPEFGEDHEIRLENLRRMAQRARRFGIGIYLYLNEPKGLPPEFFEKYPDVRGMRSRVALNVAWGMCTSTQKVQDFLRESSEFLFKRAPELTGAFLITASEFITNCYSHHFADDLADSKESCSERFCPRCGARGPVAVLTDAPRLIFEGVREASSRAEVIQWLWSWHYVMSPQEIREAIRALPAEVAVMVDWARGTPFERFGKKAVVDEYSLAFVKPSRRARMMLAVAQSQGRKVLARVQIVTSAEMNAMPYLPVLPNIVTLLREMRKYGVQGFLGSWIFGAYPGRNMELIAHEKGKAPLRTLARRYYSDKGAPLALRAWKAFSKGLSNMPESQNVLYYSDLQAGPATPLSIVREPWRRSMVLFGTDDLALATKPFGPIICAKSFRLAARYWQEGLESLRKALNFSPEECRGENLRDLGVSAACALHFRSAANHIEFRKLRDDVIFGKRRYSRVRKRLLKVIDDEIDLARKLLPIAAKDSRIGFEGSVGYFYRPLELIEKLVSLEDLRHKISTSFKSVFERGN